MTINEYLAGRSRLYEQLAICGDYIARRDDLIREADRFRIPKTEIARLLGLSRGQVTKIIGKG